LLLGAPLAIAARAARRPIAVLLGVMAVAAVLAVLNLG
jgi:hypothetical protein